MKKKTIAITAAAAVLVLGTAGVAVAVTEPWDDNDRLTGNALERASEAALAEVDGTVVEAEKTDELGHSYVVEVRGATGDDTEVALDENYEVVWVEADNDDSATSAVTPGTTTDETPAATQPGAVDADDVPLTDAERTSAQDAALAQVGSGTVTDIDRSDDSTHAFEVEVTRDDGTDVDVLLNAEFGVVGVDEDNN
ncbi:MAG: PepSY domain-containing protein [Glaciihabitans sp.]